MDDPVELAPQQLVDWATRLPAFQGVVAARASADAAPAGGSGYEGGDGVREVDPSLAGIVGDPIFNSIIEFGD